jgi:hypothetical protein
MAASDSNRLGDLMPWWLLPSQGCSNPDAATPQESENGTTSLENLGGPLPWGCDQQEPGLQDQG